MPEFHVPASAKELGFFCSYFNGDVFIYGMDTKIKASVFHGMPITVHAPIGSYTEKCAQTGVFEGFEPIGK